MFYKYVYRIGWNIESDEIMIYSERKTDVLARPYYLCTSTRIVMYTDFVGSAGSNGCRTLTAVVLRDGKYRRRTILLDVRWRKRTRTTRRHFERIRLSDDEFVPYPKGVTNVRISIKDCFNLYACDVRRWSVSVTRPNVVRYVPVNGVTFRSFS